MNVHSYSSEKFYDALCDTLRPWDSTIRVLMIGDVIGGPGRKIVKAVLPRLREAGEIDFVTANGENLAGGFGITEKTFEELINTGVNAVTMGNHWSDKPDVHKLRESPKLVLPQNLPDLVGIERIPEFEIPRRNKRISIVNLMGTFAMKDTYSNPFEFLSKAMPQLEDKVTSGNSIVVVDVHAEASSEKQVIAHYLDGIAAGLIGTHTHTPTSDERITAKGTAFLTDVGMSGPYESVIGMSLERTITRYFNPAAKKPLEVAAKDLWFCGFLLEIDPATCVTKRAHRVQYRQNKDVWTISTVD